MASLMQRVAVSVEKSLQTARVNKFNFVFLFLKACLIMFGQKILI